MIRSKMITYPNGRVLTYAYGTSGGMNDALSRIGSLIDNDGTTYLVDYSYLGLQSFVIADDTEPGIQYTLVSLTGTNDPESGDIYAGLDRFGRVKDLRWYNASTSTDVVRIEHGYDRASNRLWRQDPVAASYGKAFDELYTYDGLYRLKGMQRGTLNSTHTAINTGTETFAQCWTLDATGNWQGMKQADSGGAWTLEQARTANPVNEITAITNTTGPTWAQPAYDPAGNMTTIPQPADPTEEYTATYDAWNMLTKLVDPATSQTVQENAYDCRRFRVARKDYAAGVLSEERHFYYTSGWQSIEERLGSTPDTASPECQYVWGLRYIDDCLLRDRDSDSTGTLDERLYAMQDPNWNVVALADNNGNVKERYAYEAYGMPSFLSAAWVPLNESIVDNRYLFTGREFDALAGVIHFRYRLLNVVFGVFSQQDPLGYINGMSLYAFVLSNPIKYIDPFGCDIFGNDPGPDIELLFNDPNVKKDKSGCVRMQLLQFLIWYKNNSKGGEISRAQMIIMGGWGCVGLCCVGMNCDKDKGFPMQNEKPAAFNPDTKKGVTCVSGPTAQNDAEKVLVTLQPSEVIFVGSAGSCPVSRYCSRAVTTVRMGS